MNILIIRKKYLLPIVIAIVIIISSFGVLDEYSGNYTDDSITQAGISYAIARGINGIVSVLQTSTVHAGVGLSGSMAFGEVLDPINDLIERFSHVMSLALGSLVLQKILLVISAHNIFKILIAAFGFTIITAFLIKNNVLMLWASRIFLILIIIRFSLIIVVSINSVADNLFISTQITKGTEELKLFKEDVIKLKSNSGNSEIDPSAYKEIIRVNSLKIDEINSIVLPNIELEIDNTSLQLEDAEKNLENIQGRMGWKQRLKIFTKHKETTKEKQKITKFKDQIEKMQSNKEENKELVVQLHEEINDSKKRLAGEPVDLIEKIKSGLPSISGLRRSLSLDAIEKNITEVVENIINLSVLFILKTILIPLAFLYIFIKGIKKIWRMDMTRIISKDEIINTDLSQQKEY